MKLFWTLLLIGLSAKAQYPSSQQASFASQLPFLGKELQLNGKALKEATFLNIKVYTVGLYTEKPAARLDDLKDQQVLLFELAFHMPIPHTKLAKSWLKDLEEACQTNCAAQLKEAKVLAEKLPSLRKHQRVWYAIEGQKVKVFVQGSEIGQLESAGIRQSLLLAFLGPVQRPEFAQKLFKN